MGVVPYWAWAAAAETSAATKRNKTLGMVFITILLLGMAGGRGEHADKGARHLRSPTRLNPSVGGMTRRFALNFSRFYPPAPGVPHSCASCAQGWGARLIAQRDLPFQAACVQNERAGCPTHSRC